MGVRQRIEDLLEVLSAIWNRYVPDSENAGKELVRLRNEIGRELADKRKVDVTTINKAYLRGIPVAVFDDLVRDWVAFGNSAKLKALLIAQTSATKEEAGQIRNFFQARRQA